MKRLTIRWQRLVDGEGQTCSRCGLTEGAVKDAVLQLKTSLGALGIDVVLETGELSPALFSLRPLESNRIWIAGKPLETWLEAVSGKSRCCAVCGDADCRTLMVDGTSYEAIPAELIVRAGLLAATELLGKPIATACCLPETSAPTDDAGCCGSRS